MSRTISIEEFAQQCGYKPETIKRNYKEIPGITKEGSNYVIEYGTRYPFSIKVHKIKNSAEKRYAVLKAISEYKYIDSQMLSVPEESFEFIINDLVERKLIAKNGIDNKRGANGYDCTSLGDEIASKDKGTVTKILSMTMEAFFKAWLSTMPAQ